MWKYKLFLLTSLVIVSIAQVNSLKLLLVFPFPAQSHYFLGNELGKGLARLGHEVTIISAFEEKNPPKNYHNIVIHELMKEKEANEKKGVMNFFERSGTSPYLQLLFLSGSLLQKACEMAFNNEGVQQLMKSSQQFDAVIVEQFWNDAMKAFAPHFNAHLIVFSTIGPNRWVNNLVANPENPSYITDSFLGYTGQMSFSERLSNFVFGSVHDLVLYKYFYPKQSAAVKKYFPNGPDFDEIMYNVSLVLTNGHESINEAVPHVPNMIDIGGFHVNPPKELPKDIKEFLDNAKEGVIYFSLGSNIVPSMMPRDKKTALLKALGARKEKVLWKWDEETLENQPENVNFSKWFPQQGILSHPNCKLFISHGGLLSSIETLYSGVPVLALPVFGDQKMNAARIAGKGFGIAISFSDITEELLSDALTELLENPKYKKAAKTSSNIIHDRPIKPIELADYWIKYIVRHKGAPHLRVAGIKLPLYKYYMLDVLAFLFAAVFLSIYISYRILLLLLCRKRPVKSKSE